MESIPEETAQTDEESNRFIVFFIDRDKLRWWDYVFRTRPGFRHCYLMYWDEYVQRWLLVDWRMRTLDLMMMFNFEGQGLIDSAKLGDVKCTVVEYLKRPPLQEEGPQLLTYCSNLMAKFLGFNQSLILTPYQLYRKLIAAGGTVIFDWRKDHVRQRTEGTKPGTAEAGPDAN